MPNGEVKNSGEIIELPDDSASLHVSRLQLVVDDQTEVAVANVSVVDSPAQAVGGANDEHSQ